MDGMLRVQEDEEDAGMKAAADLLAGIERQAREQEDRERQDRDRAAKAAAAKRREEKKAQEAAERKAKKAPKNDLTVGQVVFYKHHNAGWIFVKIASVDYEGAHDGGLTYVIEASQINGVVETTRDKLFVDMPKE